MGLPFNEAQSPLLYLSSRQALHQTYERQLALCRPIFTGNVNTVIRIIQALEVLVVPLLIFEAVENQSVRAVDQTATRMCALLWPFLALDQRRKKLNLALTDKNVRFSGFCILEALALIAVCLFLSLWRRESSPCCGTKITGAEKSSHVLSLGHNFLVIFD